jgi:multidrug efflux system membrane fusion protein
MRKGLIFGAIIAVAAAGAAAFHWADRLFDAARAAETTQPPAAPPGVPITAGVVKAVDVPVFLTGIGTVQAMNTVAIKSRVDGQIVGVNYKEGENVKPGDPLVQIDPRPFQVALEQAEALKAKDEATLTSAQADLARSAQLVGPGYRTVQTYDQQKATVAQLQAAIKGDQAQIDMARLNLSYTDIRAPIAGRLGVRLIDAGNMVRATDNTVLVTITQTKPIYITFTLAQEYLHKIHEKQALGDLTVQAFGGDNVTLLSEGKLTVIDNTIDQATGTIRLKGTFANEDERLWPGEFVNVRLILRIRKGAPTVPAQTVQQGPDGSYVYVIKPDDTVERRVIEVASVQDGVAVISKGLEPGEKIVVEGQFRLTNGARIRAVTAKAAS